MRHIGIAGLVLLMAAGFSFAGDWSQWRGPNRDGVAPDSPALVDAFGEKNLKQVWESEPIVGGSNGGYGQVSIAEGRAIVHVHYRHDVAIDERVLPKNAPAQFGFDPAMPEELRDAVEKARTSDERTGITDRNKVNEWVTAWVKEHVKEEWRRFQYPVTNRLTAGKDALSLETLAKLQTIVDRKFDNQDALDAWFRENGVDDAAQKEVMKKIATTRRASEDFITCLDANTGKTLWKIERPGNWMWYPCSSTPTISGGRCYVLESTAVVSCLDVTDGRVIWESKPLGGSHGHNRSSSVLLLDGKVIVGSETGLHALDANSGEVLWSSRALTGKESSAVAWKSGDTTRLLWAAGKKVHCVDPADGKEVWSAPGGEVGSTPVVSGDVVVFNGGADDMGLTAYRIAADKAERLWTVPLLDRYASPVVHGGYVYTIGGANATFGEKDKQGKALCVELATGTVKWKETVGRGAEISSPVLADGKLIAVVTPWLYVIKADPGKYQLIGKANLGLAIWTSPAFADGKVYLRTNKSVVCYDLAKP